MRCTSSPLSFFLYFIFRFIDYFVFSFVLSDGFKNFTFVLVGLKGQQRARSRTQGVNFPDDGRAKKKKVGGERGDVGLGQIRKLVSVLQNHQR